MKRADIKIGFGCNNHCLFCVQGDKRDFCFHKEKEEVEKSMDEAKADGHNEVVFTGGEPTLHPDFLDLVRYAKKVGFKEIQIQTNGRLFAYKDFCLKTKKIIIQDIDNFLKDNPRIFVECPYCLGRFKILSLSASV